MLPRAGGAAVLRFGEAHTLAAVNDLQAGFMVVPAVGVGEVHEVSQVHTKFTLRAESRGVLPFIVDLQNRDPYDIPDETDAIVKVTDIGLARGINVLQSGANITAVREHFDWAQPHDGARVPAVDRREARPDR